MKRASPGSGGEDDEAREHRDVAHAVSLGRVGGMDGIGSDTAVSFLRKLLGRQNLCPEIPHTLCPTEKA